MEVPVRTFCAGLFLLMTGAAYPQVDLVVSQIPSIGFHGPAGDFVAYSTSVSVCNLGNTDAAFVSATNQHPVWGWGFYRLMDGRIEQVGVSWLRHPSVAAPGGGCGACNGHGGSVLGAGCLDTTSQGTNSTQSFLGPRFEVNPANGQFVYPFSNPGGPTGDAVFKRCRVSIEDASQTAALYFMELQVVHPQETGDARHNNATYRRVRLTPATIQPSFQGAAMVGAPAIMAWRDHGLGADTPDPSVRVVAVDVPGDGRCFVASKAAPLTDGWWRYDYAVQNLNSGRGVGSFLVPRAFGTQVRGVRFHDVAYHSGEPFDGTDWVFDGSVNAAWRTAHRFDELATANAIRWGTMYSFTMECDRGPAEGPVSLGLFAPGTPEVIAAAAVVPAACDADVNCDGATDQGDVACIVLAVADDTGCFCQASPDFNRDGVPDQGDIADVILVVAGAPCP